jgi:hypothetical protein
MNSRLLDTEIEWTFAARPGSISALGTMCLSEDRSVCVEVQPATPGGASLLSSAAIESATMNASTRISNRAKGIVAAVSIFLFAFVVVVPGALGLESAPTGDYSGRAYGLRIATPPPLGSDTTFADTGDLPSEGGTLTATLADVNTPAAEASVFVSWTSGLNGVAESYASTADVTLIPGNPPLVTATFVSASSRTTCEEGPSGSSEIADLMVMGTAATVTGEPNQMIVVPNVLSLVINEQNVWSGSTGSSITVNALHLRAQGVEIVVSSAHSDISCPRTLFTPPPAHDFVTGGGWIWSNGFHANFGFEAGNKPNEARGGALNWVDHGLDYHIKATTVDSYDAGNGPGDGLARTFSGEATVNGGSGYHYRITVQDNGKPGQGTDWIDFVVTDDNGFWYHPTGDSGAYLAGGNIQVHLNP